MTQKTSKSYPVSSEITGRSASVRLSYDEDSGVLLALVESYSAKGKKEGSFTLKLDLIPALMNMLPRMLAYNILKTKQRIADHEEGRVSLQGQYDHPFDPDSCPPLSHCMDPSVGFGFGDIASAAGSIIKKVGAAKILDTVQKVVDSPVGSIATNAIPGLSIATSTWKAAKLIHDGVKSGDLDVQSKLVELAEMAKNGSIDAKKLLLATKVVNDASKGSIPVATNYTGKCPPGYKLVCVPIK